MERLILRVGDAFAAIFFLFGASIQLGALGPVVVPVLAPVGLSELLNLGGGQQLTITWNGRSAAFPAAS